MTTKKSIREVLYPRSVAVVGASNTPPKIGYYVFKSLQNFQGDIFPINPNVDQVQGVKTYKSLSDLPKPVDLAIICVPAEKVPLIVEEAAKLNIKGLVIISAGFKEAEYNVGKALQEKISKILEHANLRIIGPNIFGIVNLDHGLNASFTPSFSELNKGDISIVAQSGGVCHRIMHIALNEGIGLNKIIHLGNRVDVDFPEVIDFLCRDKGTNVIVVHIEGVESGRELFDAIKGAAKIKRVVVLKTGRSSVADRASLSHTGSLAGDYNVFRDIILQAGATIVSDIFSLVDIAYAYSVLRGKMLADGGIAIISFQAGIGIIASDVVESEGAKLASLSEETLREIKEVLPPITHRNNPVDISFAALNMEVLQNVLEIILNDENVSVILFTYIMPKHWPIDPKYIGSVSAKYNKPIIAGISARADKIKELRKKFEKYKIAYYPCPERAARVAATLYLEHKEGRIGNTI